MSVTTTSVETVGAVLARANPNDYFDAVRLALGPWIEEDSGVISAASTYKLAYKTNEIEWAQIVASGTAGSLGWYTVGNKDATPAIPSAAGKADGVASLGADGQTITWPNTVTHVLVRYRPATKLLAEKFANT